MPVPLFDVLVASRRASGVPGLALAALLAAHPATSGLRIAVLDLLAVPPPSARSWNKLPLPDVPDSRRVALLTLASIELLRRVGAWPLVCSHSAYVSDAVLYNTGGPGFLRLTATSMGQPTLGSVAELPLVAAALRQQLAQQSSVEVLGGAGAQIEELCLPPFKPVLPDQVAATSDSLARLTLRDGRQLQARLVVAADDRTRQLAGLRMMEQQRGSCEATGGGMHALTATVSLEQGERTDNGGGGSSSSSGGSDGHSHVLFQCYLPGGGAIEILPLRGGLARLAWSFPNQGLAAEAAALPGPRLAAAANEALTGGTHYPPAAPASALLRGLLAPPASDTFLPPPAVLNVVGAAPAVQAMPSRFAGRLVRSRLALLGAAAHQLPSLMDPECINLGLGEARLLAATVVQAVDRCADPGSTSVLEPGYEAPRQAAAGAAAAALAAARAVFAPPSGPSNALRGVAVDLLNALPGAKQTALRGLLWGD